MKRIMIAAFLLVMALAVVSAAGSCARQQSHNINTASVEELMKVPNIDQELASNIVFYRGVNGPFASLEDLLNVKGMNEEMLEAIRPYVYIGEETPAPIPQ